MKLRRPKSRLRLKIIAWSFIPTAIILSLVALTTYLAYQRVTEEVVIERDKELTRLSAGGVSASFEDFIDRLTALARIPAVFNGNPFEQRLALDNEKNQLSLFDAGVYIVDNLGSVVANLPQDSGLIGQDWSDSPLFTSMIHMPNVLLSDIEPNGPGGEDVIAIAVPVLGEGAEFRGMVVGMFRLDANAISPFYGTLIKLRIARSGKAYLVDGNGRVIYASDFNQIGTDFNEYPNLRVILAGQVGALRTLSSDNRDIVAGYAPVPRTNWTLVVEEDWNELIRPSAGYRQFLLLLLVLGVLIPTIVVTIGVRRITGPIENFIAAANRIAGGDFSQTIHVTTNDELEELADRFNDMASELKESYETLELRVAQRTQELTALNSVTAVVSRSLDLDRILPDALAKTIEVMNMDGGAIFRLNQDTNTLMRFAHQGLNDELVNISKDLSLESSIVNQVVKTRQPIAQSISEYPPGELRNTLERAGWKTVVSIPLVAQEQVLGAINVVSRTLGKPTPEELAVPAAIGQQIGVAIDNSRLYAQSVDYAHQMELARQTADAANASKSIFLANVSHELRTPLVSIVGFARIVQKRLESRIFPFLPDHEGKLEQVSSQIKRDLDIILIEGKRLTTLINNLLDLEKIEAGKMEWHMQSVEIDKIIDQATASTASLFENNVLTLVKDLATPLPPLQADPDRILQVLINLISNAVKFSTAGTITIQAHPAGDEIVVSVIDQGAGISSVDQGRLFDKFTQVGDPLTGKPQGTGLGLAISKEIVEHHGGRIWVESNPGEGSKFSFSLPVLVLVKNIDF